MSNDTLYKRLSTRANIIIVLSTTVIFLTVLFFQVIRISRKSYLISEKDLHRIDSAIVRTRAYYHQGVGKAGSPMIEFDDTRGNNLRLTGSSLTATIDRDQLYDTLQYSGTAMTVYILNENVEDYYDDNFDRIEIYGLQIGQKSYLSLQKVNKVEYGDRYSLLIFVSVCYSLFLIIHVARVRRFWLASQVGAN